MAASSDGDSQKMARSKEKKSAGTVIASSSDEEDKNTNSIHCTPHDVRASGRRQSHRKRRKFRMPSREEQWDAISTTPVSHCLSHLKPRKLVNDFTRVTHRYNYDYVEVSGEESMEEFIKDTDSSESTDSNDSSSEAKSKSKTRGQHRVRGYRPRIATLEDSSEDEKEVDACQPSVRQQNPDTDNKGDNVKSKSNSIEEIPLQGTAKGSAALQRKAAHALTVARKSRKKTVLDSDSDVNSETDSPEDSAVVSAGKRKKKRQVQLCSDSEDKDSDASGREGSEEEIKMPRKRTKSAIESDSADNSDAEKELLFDEKESRSKDEEQKTATTSSKEEPGTSEQKKGSKLSNIPSMKTQETQCSDTGYSESTTSDEGSDSEDSDGNESNTESGEHEGRIQKLAAEKRKKKESLFGQLMSARKKRQKKT